MPSRDKWLPLSYDALRDKNVNLFKKLNSVIFPLQYQARSKCLFVGFCISERTSRLHTPESSRTAAGEAVPGLHCRRERDTAWCVSASSH